MNINHVWLISMLLFFRARFGLQDASSLICFSSTLLCNSALIFILLLEFADRLRLMLTIMIEKPMLTHEVPLNSVNH